MKGHRGKDYDSSYNPLQTITDDPDLDKDIADWNDKNDYRRRCESKIKNLNSTSLYPFISTVVTQYNFLLEYEQIRKKDKLQKFMTWIRRRGMKHVLPHHNKLLDKAIMYAMGQHYDDFADNGMVEYVKSYIFSKRNG
tara:strand:- start:74 stop:487 length:414 start_codon:yes stop_codon:yes gene_type:complete